MLVSGLYNFRSFFCVSFELRDVTYQNAGWSFPRLLLGMLLLLHSLWDWRQGSQETSGSPVGGWMGDSEGSGCWGLRPGLRNYPGGHCGFPLQLDGDGACL